MNGPVYEVVNMVCERIIEKKVKFYSFYLFDEALLDFVVEVDNYEEDQTNNIGISVNYDKYIAGAIEAREEQSLRRREQYFFVSTVDENDRKEAEKWVNSLFR